MDDRYAIHLAKSEMREGYNTGDAERVLAQLSPGYTDLSHGFPSCARDEAKAVLRARLEMLFGRYEVDFAPITADLMLLGDTALAFGWHRMTLRPRNGAPPSGARTRFLEMWRRGAEGWQLALFIDNVDPAPALASDTIAALLTGTLDAVAGTGA